MYTHVFGHRRTYPGNERRVWILFLANLFQYLNRNFVYDGLLCRGVNCYLRVIPGFSKHVTNVQRDPGPEAGFHCPNDASCKSVSFGLNQVRFGTCRID